MRVESKEKFEAFEMSASKEIQKKYIILFHFYKLVLKLNPVVKSVTESKSKSFNHFYLFMYSL